MRRFCWKENAPPVASFAVSWLKFDPWSRIFLCNNTQLWVLLLTLLRNRDFIFFYVFWLYQASLSKRKHTVWGYKQQSLLFHLFIFIRKREWLHHPLSSFHLSLTIIAIDHFRLRSSSSGVVVFHKIAPDLLV